MINVWLPRATRDLWLSTTLILIAKKQVVGGLVEIICLHLVPSSLYIFVT